jgi:hypothetical protein
MLRTNLVARVDVPIDCEFLFYFKWGLVNSIEQQVSPCKSYLNLYEIPLRCGEG